MDKTAPSREDLEAASTSSGRRTVQPVENNNLPVSWHLRSAGSPTPISPPIDNNYENIISNEHNYATRENFANDHNYVNQPQIFDEHNYAAENLPSPIHPETYRDHTYTTLTRPPNHSFNEYEQRLFEENIRNPPVLREEISERFIRQVSSFAFKYACLDVNYNVYNTDFLNSHGDYQADILQLYTLIFDDKISTSICSTV